MKWTQIAVAGSNQVTSAKRRRSNSWSDNQLTTSKSLSRPTNCTLLSTSSQASLLRTTTVINSWQLEVLEGSQTATTQIAVITRLSSMKKVVSIITDCTSMQAVAPTTARQTQTLKSDSTS